jgi:MFS family permease
MAAAVSPNLSGFVAGLALALALVASATPLNIAYWRQNVPDATRGRWFSRVTQLEALGLVVATLLMAWWMRGDASRYRPALAAWETQVIIVAVPAAVRLAALPLVGRLFDRMDFLVLRMAINGCFACAILGAFTPWLAAQLAGAVCFGLAFAGGDVAWNLWVTKYAPAERTAEYMSVHVFLTGLRGSVAPYLGFGVAAALSPPAVAWMGVCGIAVASAMLIPEARRAHRRRMAVDREPPPLSLDAPPGRDP